MAGKDEQSLCEILLRKGRLHPEQVEEALELQRIRPKRIGELLCDLGYVEEDHVLEALSEQFGIPFETDIQGHLDPSLTTKVPITFIREYQMVPYRKNGAAYCVAVNDPVNLLPLEDLRLLLGGPVAPVLCRRADIQNIIDG